MTPGTPHVTAGRPVPLEELVEMCLQPLEGVGVPSDDARLVAETLVRSEAEGAVSHGVGRLPQLVRRIQVGAVRAETDLSIDGEAPAVAAIDAHHGIGQVVADRCMRMAISKAGTTGTALVTARNSSHFGRAGHPAAVAAEQEMIGFAASNASPRVVGEPGARPVLGNNPWAVAFPSSEGPVVIDMANSVVAAGKIRAARADGSAIPEGWALDADGAPTTDPAAALTGALFAFGGHKGWALSLVVDALTGLLSGGAFGVDVGVVDDTSRQQRSSQIFGAVQPAVFLGDGEAFRDRADRLLTQLRQASGPGGRLPGDRSRRLLREHRESGLPLRPASLGAIEEAHRLVHGNGAGSK